MLELRMYEAVREPPLTEIQAAPAFRIGEPSTSFLDEYNSGRVSPRLSARIDYSFELTLRKAKDGTKIGSTQIAERFSRATVEDFSSVHTVTRLWWSSVIWDTRSRTPSEDHLGPGHLRAVRRGARGAGRARPVLRGRARSEIPILKPWFALLGKIVEAASGRPFAEFVAHEVFAPLGMKSSGYVTGPIPRERMAIGYFKEGDRFVSEPVESDGVFAPAGGVYTSANDLARYAAYHLAAYPPRDDRARVRHRQKPEGISHHAFLGFVQLTF
jgi:hypothetical protein